MVEDNNVLPLRMIVDWAYCPRLFHYNHVEGIMVANEHVWRGSMVHEHTDTPGNTRARRNVKLESVDETTNEDSPVEWREARAVDLADTNPRGDEPSDLGDALPTVDL